MKQLLSILMLCFVVNSAFAQGDVAQGESLFKANCAACHKPDRNLIGPALKGVNAKYENDIDYITAFVQNSQDLIASGDERANAIYEEFNKQTMTAFPTLSKQDVTDILAYADSFEKAESTGMKIRPIKAKPQSSLRPLYLMQNIGAWVFYAVGVLLLIGALFMLVVMNDMFEKRKNDAGENEF